MNDLGIPVLQKGEPLYKYELRLNKYLLEGKLEKQNKILKFINDWYSTKKNNNYIFKSLYEFKNQYYIYMPDDKKSKEFLIKKFNEYDEYFKLELEYDETLFTTYNVLYFIKLMLKTINGDLKKELEEKEDDDGYKKIYKKYTIKIKNKL